MDGLNFKMTALNIVPDDPVDMQGLSTESLSIGQLKTMSNGQAKLKPQQYAMRYEDEDTVFDELEEFLSYQEVQQLGFNLSAWEGSFRGGQWLGRLWSRNADTDILLVDWAEAPAAAKRSYVEVLLESLEYKDADVRLANVRKLLYIIQGELPTMV